MSKAPIKKALTKPQKWALGFLAVGGILAALGIVIGVRIERGLQAVQPGAPPHFIRIESSTSLRSLFQRFKQEGMLRDLDVANLYAWVSRARRSVSPGTYRLGPGMSVRRLIFALSDPVHQSVRLKEGRWAARTARSLARAQVCTPDQYLALVRQPKVFAGAVDFPLPSASLEGYLYPDTYDLPPLLGAAGTIARQLKTFQTKIYGPLGHPAGINQLVTIASLIELEVKFDDERPLVSAVIKNRLKLGMPLQIDASLNYGLGQWRPLAIAELHTVPGPYNLYTHKGLPPSPICSPTFKSVEAALHPAPVPYLYYVAMPDGHSLFAKTFAEHRKNIQKRVRAMNLRTAQEKLKPS